MYLEYRDFAFLQEGSQRAAEAAACAADQGRFWQYHDTLFLNQDPRNPQAFHPDRLKEMGRLIGLDMEQFAPCVDNRTHRAAIEAMTAEARDRGHQGTPSFEVNGEVVPWTREGWEPIRARIEAELNR